MTKKGMKSVVWGALLAAASGLYSGIVAAQSQFNLQTPQTPIAQKIFDLHTLITWICVIIFVGVFGVMFWAVFKHRKAAGHKAAQFHENTVVELVWTIVPFFILIAIAFPATRTVIEMKDTSDPDVTIKATGYQWKWGYDYLTGEGQGVSFFSTLSTPREQIEGTAPKGENYLLEVDNPVVVPVGKKVRILTTAQDVIHAWWVPALGAKQDAIPGFIRDTWFRAEKVGTYRGQCAELCGKDHGFMPIVVEVVPEEQYKAWVAQQKTKQAAGAGAGAVADGKGVYERVCQACHATGVAGAPKTGDKAAWAPRIAQGNDKLYEHSLKGFKAMPAKGGAPDLPDAQIKAAVDHMLAASK